MSIESQISKLKEEGIYLWEETGKLKYRAKEGGNETGNHCLA